MKYYVAASRRIFTVLYIGMSILEVDSYFPLLFVGF